jgi:putative mRNA 3-end processing factor
MSSIDLRRGGLHVFGTELWLDAKRKSPLSFVSHGHADHIARHERIIATKATLAFMGHRLGRLPAALPVPYNRPFELGPLSIELLPAGHILGSAQIRITREDGRRIVYTGDLNLAPSLTAEPIQVAECDTLVIEATFGHPRYRFPPKREVLDQVAAWIERTRDQGLAPVLLGYPLGKSQEAIKQLGQRGFRFALYDSVWEMTELYRELGCPLSYVRRFNGRLAEGEVAFFPPHLWRKSGRRRLGPSAAAVLTGWALDAGAAARYGADVAFPISDHADFPSLIEYVKSTKATEVITHHGFARELASALSQEGIDARPLGSVKQLSLF